MQNTSKCRKEDLFKEQGKRGEREHDEVCYSVS